MSFIGFANLSLISVSFRDNAYVILRLDFNASITDFPSFSRMTNILSLAIMFEGTIKSLVRDFVCENCTGVLCIYVQMKLTYLRIVNGRLNNEKANAGLRLVSN
jgi:hypothetical protein